MNQGDIRAPTLHDITNKALVQWVEVTGINPDEEKDEWTWGSYQTSQINDYIKTAQDIDPSGLTAFMVTRAVALDYVNEHQFNALDLIKADASTKKRLEALGILVELVENRQALSEVAEFQEQLREAAAHYGITDEVAETIDDLNELSHIRRDALVCTKLLDLHTFAKGKKTEDKLKYNERVLKFWNMNSLIRAANVQPENGISIVLVRDPNIFEYSFFCFLVRDGENTSIWTDAEKGDHPMQKYMRRSRSLARDLQERMSRLRFPYQLLKAKFDDEGKRAWEAKGADLVQTNIEAIAIGRIKDLEPDQILWAIMALDVLRKAEHEDELSGTAEGMVTQLPPGTKGELMIPGYLPTVPLEHEDVTSENIHAQLETCGYSSTGVNNWMEERYHDQVDERLYNLTEPQTEAKALAAARDPHHDDDEKVDDEMVVIGGARVDAAGLLPNARGVRHKMEYAGDDRTRAPGLIGADPVSFGSQKEMEADRLWIARWNQAQALGMAAVAEFDARKDEVVEWFRARIHAMEDVLIGKMIEGAFDVETSIVRSKGGFDNQEGGVDTLIHWHRKGKGGVPCDWMNWWGRPDKDGSVALFERPKKSTSPTKGNPLRCYVTGATANCWALFRPQTPEGIAALAGIKPRQLPELLERWNPEPPYNGNSILQRTDPLDSQVGNPWNALRFAVLIGISKREWNRRAKMIENPKSIRWQIEKWYYSDRGSGKCYYWSYEDEDD